jgi:four helix bundle protein
VGRLHFFLPLSGEEEKMQDDNRFAFQKLDCYEVARAFAKGVHEARIRDAELRDQATRAAKSAFLGLCEGLPNEQPGLRRRYFTQANNSLHEAVGAVDLAAAIAAITPEVAEELQSLGLRLKRMLRALRGG